MRAGTLRHVVEVQTKTITQNTIGEGIETWATSYTRRCSVEQLSGNEAMVAAQVTAGATHKVTMRHDKGLTTANRLKFKGRYFDINAINNVDEMNHEMILICKESV